MPSIPPAAIIAITTVLAIVAGALGWAKFFMVEQPDHDQREKADLRAEADHWRQSSMQGQQAYRDLEQDVVALRERANAQDERIRQMSEEAQADKDDCDQRIQAVRDDMGAELRRQNELIGALTVELADYRRGAGTGVHG